MLRERKVICVGTEQSVRTITIGEVMNYTHLRRFSSPELV